jgi:hypothetical protein
VFSDAAAVLTFIMSDELFKPIFHDSLELTKSLLFKWDGKHACANAVQPAHPFIRDLLLLLLLLLLPKCLFARLFDCHLETLENVSRGLCLYEIKGHFFARRHHGFENNG